MFIICLIGFVLKNKIGVFNIVDIMELCRCLEEFSKVLMNIVDIVIERKNELVKIVL